MYGLNIDIMNNPHGNPPASVLKNDLGVELARFSYHDKTDSDRPDPAMLDFFSNKVDELAGSEIRSLLILGYSTYPNKPAYEAPAGEWSAYIDKLVRRIGQLAGNFSPVAKYVSFQIWNEPDLADTEASPQYDPRLPQKVCAELLEKACKVILEVDKDIEIIGPGLCSGIPAWWTGVYRGQPIDAIGVHLYGQRPQPAWPSSTWGFGYVGTKIEEYQAVWKGKIWITEIGNKDLAGEQQAEYLRKFYNELSLYPSVKECAWFCYSHGMVPGFGLVKEDSTREPAYAAYREVSGVT